MKIAVSAEFADALALAASLSGDTAHRPFDAVRLSAAGDTLTITANVHDFELTQTVPASVATAGEVAVPASRLAALVAGFDTEATVEISSSEIVANVSCGRSRFKLPTIAMEDLPGPLKLTEETGSVTLAREEATTLLVRPAFATSTEKARHYLAGILLRDHEEALAAVAVDGRRLWRARVPAVTGLSSDLTLIVPNAALKIVAKLLADKNVERVTLRRSRTLFALGTARAVFVSKLIDGQFPETSRIIPNPSGNHIVVARAELLRALDRIAAVIDPGSKAMRTVGLQWAPDDSVLRLCVPGHDFADDAIVAEVAGNGRIAVQIPLLAEMLDRLSGKCVRLDSRSGTEPLLITDPDDVDTTSLLMACVWAAQAAQAA